jgi:hypothetical protein
MVGGFLLEFLRFMPAHLKAHGQSVTIKTLYHLAKQTGVEIAILPNFHFGNMAKLEIIEFFDTEPIIREKSLPLPKNHKTLKL